MTAEKPQVWCNKVWDVAAVSTSKIQYTWWTGARSCGKI